MRVRTFGILLLLCALPVMAQNKAPVAKTATEAEKKIEAEIYWNIFILNVKIYII